MKQRTKVLAKVMVLVSGLAVITPSFACRVNPDATSPELRHALTGTWYSERHVPQLGMVSKVHQTFLPTGVWEYQDATCSMPGLPCSRGGGHGLWMATRMPDGGISIRIKFSDLRRTNACTGSVVYMTRRGVLTTQDGAVAQRVR